MCHRGCQRLLILCCSVLYKSPSSTSKAALYAVLESWAAALNFQVTFHRQAVPSLFTGTTECQATSWSFSKNMLQSSHGLPQPGIQLQDPLADHAASNKLATQQVHAAELTQGAPALE